MALDNLVRPVDIQAQAEDIAEDITGTATNIYTLGKILVASNLDLREKGKLRKLKDKAAAKIAEGAAKAALFAREQARAYDEHRRNNGITLQEASAVLATAGKNYRVVERGGILYVSRFHPAEDAVNAGINELAGIAERLQTPEAQKAVAAASLMSLFLLPGNAFAGDDQAGQQNTVHEATRYERVANGGFRQDANMPVANMGSIVSVSYPLFQREGTARPNTGLYAIQLEQLVNAIQGSGVNANSFANLGVYFPKGCLVLAVPERINVQGIEIYRAGQLIQAEKAFGYDAIVKLIQQKAEKITAKHPFVASVQGLLEMYAAAPAPQNPAFRNEDAFDIRTLLWEGIARENCDRDVIIKFPVTYEPGFDPNIDRIFACLRYEEVIEDSNAPNARILRLTSENTTTPRQVEFSFGSGDVQLIFGRGTRQGNLGGEEDVNASAQQQPNNQQANVQGQQELSARVTQFWNAFLEARKYDQIYISSISHEQNEVKNNEQLLARYNFLRSRHESFIIPHVRGYFASTDRSLSHEEQFGVLIYTGPELTPMPHLALDHFQDYLNSSGRLSSWITSLDNPVIIARGSFDQMNSDMDRIVENSFYKGEPSNEEKVRKVKNQIRSIKDSIASAGAGTLEEVAFVAVPSTFGGRKLSNDSPLNDRNESLYDLWVRVDGEWYSWFYQDFFHYSMTEKLPEIERQSGNTGQQSPSQQPSRPVQESSNNLVDANLTSRVNEIWGILEESQEFAAPRPADFDESMELGRQTPKYRRERMPQRKAVLRRLTDYFSPFGYKLVKHDGPIFSATNEYQTIEDLTWDVSVKTLDILLDVESCMRAISITQVGTPRILAQGTPDDIYQKVKILTRSQNAGTNGSDEAKEMTAERVATGTREVLYSLERTLRDYQANRSSDQPDFGNSRIQQYALVSVQANLDGVIGYNRTNTTGFTQSADYTQIFFQFQDRWYLLMPTNDPTFYNDFKSHILESR